MRRLDAVARELIGSEALNRHDLEAVRFMERARKTLSCFAPAMRLALFLIIFFIEYEAVIYSLTRFSRLDAEKRQRHFARFYSHPKSFWRMSLLRLVQSFVLTIYYSDPNVAQVAGYPEKSSPQKPALNQESVPQPKDVHAASTQDIPIAVDYLVIGSGAGGAVVATGLAEAGKEVIVLEEGAAHDTRDFQKNSYDRYMQLYRDGGMIASLGFPPIVIPVGKTLGGTTTINSGTCFRLPDNILEKWRTQQGLTDLSMAELSPYFDDIEKFLGVAPVAPSVQGPNFMAIDRGIKSLGLDGGPLMRNAPGCVGAAECCFGCPSGAKLSMEASFMPRALKAGARAFTRIRVKRILHAGHRATGVLAEILDDDSRVIREVSIEANHVIVSCGTLLSPVLLKRSGIVASSALGRHLTVHPTAKVVGFFDEPLDGFKGVPQGYYTEFMHDKGLMYEPVFYPPWLMAVNYAGIGNDHARFMDLYRHYGIFGFLISDEPKGRIIAMPDGRPLIFYSFTRREHELYIEGLKWLCRILFASGARRIYTGAHGVPVITSLKEVEELDVSRLPRRKLEAAAFHPLGTCRMGRYPQDSVVDVNLRVHDYDNLFIADGSVFPSSLGVNPQLTIMAFAARLADKLK